MKFQTDLQPPLWRPVGCYRTQRSWLCIAALALVALPGTPALKINGTAGSKRQGTVEAQPANLQGGAEVGNMVALKGAGGGLNVLEAEDKSDGHDKYYPRPWKTRFELRPFDFDDHNFLTAPENRMSYRHFHAANPRIAEAPNTRDRNAQSDVLLVFGATAVATVIGAVLIVTKFEVLRADELDLVSYQQKMLSVIVCAAGPWLVLGAYVMMIFLTFVGNPMRHARGTYHWQCSAMTWFIFVAPAINLLYFTSHAIWISRICFSVEQQAPMGRMFSLGIVPTDHPGHDVVTRVTNMASHSVARQMLLFLEVVCAVAGYMLITFRWGANSQFCQPEVYWTTTALCVTVCIVIVFTAAAFVCSIIIRAFSVSPWMQDFAESFWQADLEAKIARNESKEERAGARAQAKAAEEVYEAQFKEWLAFHEEHEEDRKRHEEIMQEHAEYHAATKGPAPQRGLQDIAIVQDDSTESPTPPQGMDDTTESPTPPQGMDPLQMQDTVDEWTNFNGMAAPQSQMVSSNPFGQSMQFEQSGRMPGQPVVLPPQRVTMPAVYRDHGEGASPMPPGSGPMPLSSRSQPPASFTGNLQPGTYGYNRAPMPMSASPASFRGAPSGSLPPASFTYQGTPGTMGTMPPSYPGGASPFGVNQQLFMPTVRSVSESGSDEDERRFI